MRLGLLTVKASLLIVMLAAVLLCVEAGEAFAGFGFQRVENTIVNEGGSADIQAGSHPFAIDTTFALNQEVQPDGISIPSGDLKDLQVKLPSGLVGNPTALPRCSSTLFYTPRPRKNGPPGDTFEGADCPESTQVGIARVELNINEELKPPSALYLPVYNLVPPPGVPAAFGFNPLGLAVVLTAKVRTGEDYGVTIDSENDSQVKRVYGVTTTLWGVPYAHSHDGQRGECLGIEGTSMGACPVEQPATPFLTMPTSCSSSPLTTFFYADSWQHPLQSLETEGVEAEAVDHDSEGDPVGLGGCELLDFSPKVSAQPETGAAASPTGLNFELSLPQNQNPTGLAEADLRNAVLTLPAGVSVSPSAGDGLGACTSTPETGRPGGEIALESDEVVQCPNSSKVGTVEIETPLLEIPLTGSVYLAQPNANKFNSLLALYLVAEGDGVLIKLAAHVEANPLTGQLTTVVDDAPQQPFSNLKLHFFGGPRAALMTPQTCGIYEANSQLTPWSSPTETPVSINSPFDISTSCGGGFAPTMVAGTTSNQAGAYSPLTTTISRSDQDQNLSKITLTTPPGLLGMLSHVQLCGEPQAQQGDCPEASKIGHVTATSGAGPTPLQLPLAGKPQDPVFLTGPYDGAPFGLSIVVPAEAGPFNLGDVVVRAAINVNPHTAQITISSESLPQFVHNTGIPLDVRTVNVIVDREDFIFNPTNCEPSSEEGTLNGAQGASAAVATRFQAANCASLPFTPKFTVLTQAKTSKAEGAYLHVKLTSGPGQANIAKVKVDLPLQLPSRLTTLQKACTLVVFEANPANCPAASVVGTATAHTPVLTHPLAGPAYLVSHGGAAFPDLEMVLQGEGVTLVLDGNTDIKKGITSSLFKTVPDAPISTFESRASGGSTLGAGVERKPLQGAAEDAHRDHRPEWGHDQTEHHDHGHRLPQACGQEGQGEKEVVRRGTLTGRVGQRPWWGNLIKEERRPRGPPLPPPFPR